MNTGNHIHPFAQRLILIILVSLIISGTYYLFAEELSWRTMLVNFLYTFLYWQGNYTFSCYVESRFPKIEATTKKFTIYISFAFIYAVVVTFLVHAIIYNFSEPFKRYVAEFLVGLGVTLFISTIYAAVSYFQLFKESVIEKESLKRMQVENELKVLSSQVNPHFLFNSLNTLMSLIPENPKLALEFTRKFSDVYRYVLQSRNKEVVSLEEELEFVDKFIFLMKIRHGENLHSLVNIDSDHLKLKIPSLVLQMVVENATKHNVISNDNPLFVEITSDGDFVIVKNNVNPKQSQEDGTRTGLENIRKRYELLSGKKMEVTVNKDFIVKLPLLLVQKYEVSHH